MPIDSTMILQAAIDYYNQGFCPVILHGRRPDGTCTCSRPDCTSIGKHPRFVGWQQRAAKATIESLTQDITHFPDSNLGLLCGNYSHLTDRQCKWIIAIDEDRRGGVDGRQYLSTLPLTLTAATPSGGHHYVYKHPGKTVKTIAGFLPHIDIRGDKNGQIVVYPSKGYSWVNDAQIADFPESFLDSNLARAIRYLAKVPPAVAGQHGHDAAWTAIMHTVKGFDLTESEALLALQEYNLRCNPPWSTSELLHKIRDALASTTIPTGAKLKAKLTVTAGQTASGPEGMICKSDGSVKPLLTNAITLLQDLSVHYDIFANRIMIKDRQWCDADDIALTDKMQAKFRCEWTVQTIATAVQAIAYKNKRHPVRDYLSSLSWDGVLRLPTWLHDYLGVQQTDYSAAIGTKWLIAAVARIFQPGCQADNMIILEGPQGAKKSTSLEALFTKPYFTDQISDIGSKDCAQDLQGKWCIELAELDAMRRADVSRTKAFITRRTDHYRAPYSRHSVDYPRQCIFAGTVNLDCYLTDETGGRRFWPVRVGKINIDAILRDRDKLFSEAVARYKSNEVWYIDTDSAVNSDVKNEQTARYDADAWTDTIAAWLDTQAVKNAIYDQRGPTTGDILHCLDIPVDRWDRSSQMRVARIMRSLGYVSQRLRVNGTRQRIYVPVPPP